MSDLLSKIRELRGKATKGPWWEDADASGFALFLGNGGEVWGMGHPAFMLCVDSDKNEGYANGEADAALIVLLVNHLDEIEKALEEKRP